MSRLEFPLRAEDFRPPADLAALGSRGLVVGGLAAVATVAGFFLDGEHFFPSYLVAWLLWFHSVSNARVLSTLIETTPEEIRSSVLRHAAGSPSAPIRVAICGIPCTSFSIEAAQRCRAMLSK